MRTVLLTLSFFLLLQATSFAQETSMRKISIKTIDADSMHIPLSDEYYVIENNCSSVLRQVRYNHQTSSFHGRFVDVSTTDNSVVLGEGNYTQDGKKDGPFTIRYSNGNIRSSGSFTQDEFTGTWQLFYENGDPKLVFTVADGTVIIQDAWDEKGNKYVSDGTGNYQVGSAFISWSGKLVNGKPDGTWKAKHSINSVNPTTVSEKFKDGKFMKGNGPLGPYTDASRIDWINLRDFPFLQAELMAVSRTTCGETIRTPDRFVSAQHRNGLQAYSDEIGRHVSDYLENVDLKAYAHELVITGIISESGKLTNLLYKNAFDQKIAIGITKALAKVSTLKPASINGNPVKQDFEITFKFYEGVYRFEYRFLPITVQNN